MRRPSRPAVTGRISPDDRRLSAPRIRPDPDGAVGTGRSQAPFVIRPIHGHHPAVMAPEDRPRSAVARPAPGGSVAARRGQPSAVATPCDCHGDHGVALEYGPTPSLGNVPEPDVRIEPVARRCKPPPVGTPG